jgi:hypothetical protein
MLRKISMIVTCALAFAGGVAASEEPTTQRPERTFTLFQQEAAAPASLSSASRQRLEASTEGQDLVNVRWFKQSAIDPAEFAVGDRLIIQVGPNEAFELEILLVHDHASTAAGTISISGSPPGQRSLDLFLEFASITKVKPDQTLTGGSLRVRDQVARAFTMNVVPEAPGFIHVREIVNFRPGRDVVVPVNAKPDQQPQ